LKTIQDEEKLFQVPRHFKIEERSKNGQKTANFALDLLPHVPHFMRLVHG